MRAAWLIVASVLLVLAISWPLVEYGPNGPLLWRISATHGIDTRDLLSIPLLILACLAARRAVS